MKKAAEKTLAVNNENYLASELDSTKKVLTVEYYCAKKNRPLTEFEALIDLEIKLNVDMGRVLHCRKTGLAIIEQISNH